MTALSITYNIEERLERSARGEQKGCLYCGKHLTIFRKLGDEQFCDNEHRRLWRMERIARTLRDA